MCFVMGIFFSCKENDMAIVQEIGEENVAPFQTTYNGHYTFTDSGRLRNTLEAGKLQQWTNDSDFVNVSDGLKLTIFDKRQEKNAVLTADRGLYYQKQEKMEAHGNVVFSNVKGDTLLTEMLTWYSDSNLIYTDSLVDIKRADGHIKGRGLRSNQEFSKYTILAPTGNINLKEEE